MRPLRIVFMGTPQFAVPALESLIASRHEVACVYCQPPRRAGRGRKERASPVEAVARREGIEVRTPAGLKSESDQATFADLKTDAAVVAAYGLLLPTAILKAPRLGCLNIHPSLLPRWRGAAPIARAILAGDSATGVAIMAMDEGLDTGPVVLSKRVAIGPDQNAGELSAVLAALGAGLILDAIDGLDAGTLVPVPQSKDGVTYAPKLQSGEERLDWREDAVALSRRVRAFAPQPGTWFELDGERIRVLAAKADMNPQAASPGTVLDDGLLIACGKGALRLLAIQRAGRAAMPAAAFLRGRKVEAGTVLASPA